MNKPPQHSYVLWHHVKNNQLCRQGYWTVHWCVHRGEKQIRHTVHLLCFHNSVRCILCVCVCSYLCEAGDCFIFSSFHSSPLLHFHLRHYFSISELHLNSTDYTLFLNDHSWGLRIQKPFGSLGPSGLPYITNHIQHWGLSTCKAYTYLRGHKSQENELKGCFLFVCISVERSAFCHFRPFSCCESHYILSVWLTIYTVEYV